MNLGSAVPVEEGATLGNIVVTFSCVRRVAEKEVFWFSCPQLPVVIAEAPEW